ncbi:MAG: AmmeMemoRadiSam system protein A [Bacteroidales bacterium]|nr:AmmeMemoRadiSam system protein A [Bacteroidales bacterium]
METTREIPEKNDFELSVSDRITLLKLARKTLEEKIRHGKIFVPDTSNFSENLKIDCGAFVSLHVYGKLRGCIGRMTGDIPLYRMIQEMAVSSAIHDPRFNPVQPDELANVDIELSVLSPLKKISDVSEIQLGKHGILIIKGHNSGVFLPQVATETNWNLDEFLGHCSHDKAGLDWFGWKTADIFIFTADVFGEKEVSV